MCSSEKSQRISRVTLGTIAACLLIVSSACNTGSSMHSYKITPRAVPAGTVGQPYEFKFFCDDPLGCELYELSHPDTQPLPPGLIFECAGACLDQGSYADVWGVPTTPGKYTFEVDACSLSNNGIGFGSFDCGAQATEPPVNPDVYGVYTVTINPAEPPLASSFSPGAVLTSGYGSVLDDTGNTMVLGAGLLGGVAARVLANSSGGWSQVATLFSSYGESSLAISGDGNTVVLACCGTGIGTGEVYVYVAPAGGWINAPNPMHPTATLTASDITQTTSFAFSLATDMTGDTIAVGEPCDPSGSGATCGAVYVFAKQGAWVNATEDAQLTVSTTKKANATLGFSLAMNSSGGTIVAGLPGLEASTSPGAVFVFEKPAGGWTTVSSASATLQISDSISNGVAGLIGLSLGSSVSISGDGSTIVAGAPKDGLETPDNPGGGAAYVFVNPSPSSGWTSNTENAVLMNSNNSGGDRFGEVTAINTNGSTVVVGASISPVKSPGFGGPGEVYVFQKPTGGWMGRPQNEFQTLISFPAIDASQRSVFPAPPFGGPGNVALNGSGSTLAICSAAEMGPSSVVYLFSAIPASAALAITTTSPLPPGTINSGYDLQFNATGGTPPYSWNLVTITGNVPPGMGLSASGLLSGIPTAVGSYDFDIQVIDSALPPNSSTSEFTLLIATPVSITTTSLPGATAGQQYTADLAASGGTQPYSWSLSAGSLLPAGLSLSSGGVISGTPVSSGVFNFSVQVTDASNPQQSDSKALSLVIGTGTGTHYSGAGFLLLPYQQNVESTPPLVALDNNGDTVVVVNTDLGVPFVTVFAKYNADTWISISTLDPLGISLPIAAAISGDGSTIAVTSSGCGSNGTNNCVFVITRPPGGWLNMPPNFGHPLYLLQEANPVQGDKFGASLAIDYNGDTIVAGAPCDTSFGNPSCGTAYVYTRPPCGDWSNCQGSNGFGTETAALSLSMISGGVQVPVPTLGFSVAIDGAGQNIVAGAPGLQPNLSQTNTPGIAYLFGIPSGGWATWDAATNAPVKLFASDHVNGDLLGWSTAISGDGGTVVAGALLAPFSASSAGGPGAAYVFQQGMGWASKPEDAKLAASLGQDQDLFGASVAVATNGSTVVVGAPQNPYANNKAGLGSIYVFPIPANGWTGGAAQPVHETQVLTAYPGEIISHLPSTPLGGFGFTQGLRMTSDASIIVVGGIADANNPSPDPLEVVYWFQ